MNFVVSVGGWVTVRGMIVVDGLGMIVVSLWATLQRERVGFVDVVRI